MDIRAFFPSRIVFFAVKIVVSAALLGLLIYFVDARGILLYIYSVSPIVLVAASLFFLAGTLLNTFRWQSLLALQELTVPVWRLFSYNLSYSFYLFVLPGGRIAAEAIRVYQIGADYAAQDGSMRERAGISAIADRAIATLSFLVVASLVYIFDARIHSGIPLWFGLAAILGALVVFAAIWYPIFDGALLFLVKKLPGIVRNFVERATSSLARYRVAPQALFLSLCIACVADVLFAASAYVIALGLGVDVSFSLILAAYMFGMVAMLIPITVGGIGLREGTFAAVLSLGGVAPEAAVALSLLTLAASIAVSLLGGVVELHRHFLRKPAV